MIFVPGPRRLFLAAVLFAWFEKQRVRLYEAESIMSSERLGRITIDDAQCGGRPCIRHMRIRVSDVLDLLSSGADYEEILQDYPYLEREDILAAIEYAARLTDHAVLRSM